VQTIKPDPLIYIGKIYAQGREEFDYVAFLFILNKISGSFLVIQILNRKNFKPPNGIAQFSQYMTFLRI